MRVTIYLKSSDNPSPTLTYELEREEFQRLARDFEKYLKEGQPQGGSYRQLIPKEDNGKEEKAVFIDFTLISVLS